MGTYLNDESKDWRPRGPRQYPAMHPEKPKRALLFVLAVVFLVVWTLGLAWTYQPGADQPENSPDIMVDQP